MQQDRVSSTFAALAHPTRRAILARLTTGETTVAELAKPFDMSLPAVSKHLKVLERAGLIGRRKMIEVFVPELFPCSTIVRLNTPDFGCCAFNAFHSNYSRLRVPSREGPFPGRGLDHPASQVAHAMVPGQRLRMDEEAACDARRRSARKAVD